MAASTSAAMGRSARPRSLSGRDTTLSTRTSRPAWSTPGRADGDENVSLFGELQSRRAEHDRRKVGLWRSKLGRDRGDPHQEIAFLVLQHAADRPAIGIVVGRSGRIAHAKRIAADPGAHRARRHRPFGAAEREAGEADGVIEVLHQTGELLDGEIGEGEIERGRRPHHDAIFCVPATVGERVDIGERDAIEFGLLDAEAAEPRPHQSDHFAGARIIASNRHHLADARAFGAGTVESLADEHHRALRCLDIEHRSGRGDDRLEETRMKRLDVAAGDDEKICTVARLGERRHHPSGRLQHFEIAVLRLAQGVIDDAARALGERDHRAHALDIGGKPAIERKLRLAEQLSCLLDGLAKGDILAADLSDSTAAACARSPRPTSRTRSSGP